MGSLLFTKTSLQNRHSDNEFSITKEQLKHKDLSPPKFSISKPIYSEKRTRNSLLETNVDQLNMKMKNSFDNKTYLNHIYKKMFVGNRLFSSDHKHGNLNCSFDIKIESNNLNNTFGNITNEIENKERSVSLNKSNVYNFKNCSTSNVNLSTSVIDDIVLKDQTVTSNLVISNEFKCENKTNYEDIITIKRTFSFIEKNGEDSVLLRNSYYSKLISKNIWEMKKQDYNSIFIFDWDDTLLSTTFITPSGVFDHSYRINSRNKPMFKEIDRYAFQLLSLALTNGAVFIVTNAVTGWVEISSKIFLPNVAILLSKITIISARKSFEKEFPGNSRQWKIETFKEIQKCFKPSLVTNLICVGDSLIEIEAAHIISKNFLLYYLKTIKFMEKPKPEVIIKELKLVIKHFDYIYSSLKNLNINVEKKLPKKTKIKGRQYNILFNNNIV